MPSRAASNPWDRLWRSRPSVGDFYPSSRAFMERVIAHVAPGCRVLEVGPGTGRDAAAAAEHGGKVVALDRSGEALALMQRSGLARAGLVFLRADGLCAPFPDDSFDLVCHQGLLEHFRDPLPLLRENHRLLKPGGVLIVDVPQTYHPWTVIKKVLLAANRWFAGWETQYTPGQLRRVVERAGFEVVEVYGDWMRPGLAYRSMRSALRRVHAAVPEYPPWPLSTRLGTRWLGTSAGLRTAFTIGVVARRQAPPARPDLASAPPDFVACYVRFGPHRRGPRSRRNP